MKAISITGVLVTLGIWTLLLGNPSGRGDESSVKTEGKSQILKEGIEVQTRGQVHEAFAQPVVRGAGASPVIKKKPPEAVEELPPDQKPEGDRVTWIPGYWGWDEDRTDFLWVSGTWRNAPPGRHWIPGYWNQAESGYEWVSGHWGVENTNEVEILPPPPDPIAESPTAAPDANSSYAPGCWVYRENRYLWRPGMWHAYRPGWAWITPSYFSTPAGYAFVDGYWDYDFHHRGLLFAPVLFDRGALGRRGWSYRPSYVVDSDFLLGGLFAQVASQHYFFGDYYDPRYQRMGYVSWLDFRIGDRFNDPMYNYYRWTNRNNSGWEKTLSAQYSGRRAGTMTRPPRTLALQVKNGTGTGGKGIMVVSPLAQLKSATVKLTPVSQKEMRDVHIKGAANLRTLSQKRSQGEIQLRDKRSKSGSGAAAAAKFELARPKTTARPLKKAPPPVPVHPKTQAKPVTRPAPQGNPKPSPRPSAKPSPKPAPTPSRAKPTRKP